MLTREAKSESIALAQKVAGAAVLTSVVPSKIELTSDLQKIEKCGKNLAINIILGEHEPKFISKTNLLASHFASVDYYNIPDGVDKEEYQKNVGTEGSAVLPVCHILVEMTAVYLLPDESPPPDVAEDKFRSFASLNGLLNLWPYIRSEVSRLSNSIGLPFTLPFLKIVAENKQA